VHNLRLLSAALAQKDTSIAQLVDGGDRTFGALAGQSAALRTSVARLPGTLSSADRALTALTPFARVAAPALRALVPTAEALPDALTGVDPLLRDGAPALRATSTLAARAVPVVRTLEPALRSLSGQTSNLTQTFRVLGRLTNELAHVPGGNENSYLFSLAWFAHNGNSLVSGEDANGVFWHGSVILSCSNTTLLSPVAKLLGPVIDKAGVCPGSPGKGD
jgi:ABC-type transporter Mla subunit MlaD